ncbi:pyridoxamine 5'-phosphate oxidase family protein [Rhodohalobacter sp.]|uniref:pyridoxamine 5'-phosphate oxidase family protein n=1 Tax=Rhodohalobacter sp. TaxID=1974210 RepID=UPI002ACD5145|nr:pyridoxamine 5'-phosphate oxidase family protein [Rhodohalobacter sp.]MDZ7758066.1 pyridoxamine 5'-phosphate oxidase family protein [Rhodohalobacter sp.]
MSKQEVVTEKMSLKEAWDRVMEQVKEAVSGGGHSYRYVTLATVDKTNLPQQRTVVLRDFSDESEFTVYTDSRSEKVSEMMENGSVSLLFYDDKKKLQLRVNGSASIIKAGDEYKRNWENRGSKSPHSYTSVIPPGTEIESPEKAFDWHLEGTPNFCLIKIKAERMEFLQLNGVEHIRAEKIVGEGEEKNRWIAP